VAEIKRRKNESFEAFMRRVKKRWQQSGKILQVKKVQFFSHKPSKTRRQKSALHRIAMSDKISYLKRIGRLADEALKR
jgi:ribosomal protein S21